MAREVKINGKNNNKDDIFLRDFVTLQKRTSKKTVRD